MIAIFASEKTPLTNYTDFHVVHAADGNDRLHFSLPVRDEQYPLLQEEMQVEAAGNLWLIKKIYDDDINCELNLDALKQSITKDYDSGSVTLQTILTRTLPSGWSSTGAGQVSIRRTIKMDFCTPFDILQECMHVFSVAFRWDVPNKRVTVIVPSAMPLSGEYLTDELNLRKLSYQGDTTDFATRLYAYGKDGLTMENAAVDGSAYGKTYVEDFSYSSKIVSAYWEDERYTNPDSLYTDAKKRLAELAKPVQAYTCDAEDLAKKSDDYAFLAFQVHRKITLIDTHRSLRVVHQIVEYDEYPEEPNRSVVTLSTRPPTIGSVTKKQLADVELAASNITISAVDNATALITGAKGGYIVYHYDADGKPYEMLIMDTANEATAVNVWRYNQNGWGHSSTGVEGPYTLAATLDGGIVADYITAGTMSADRIAAGTISLSKLDASARSTINGANAQEQLIYISKAAGTTSVSAITTWVTNANGRQNTWTIKRPTYSSSYPVLFVATQRKAVDGTITCTTPQIDNTTTVIDGGHITTGTIDASRIKVGGRNNQNGVLQVFDSNNTLSGDISNYGIQLFRTSGLGKEYSVVSPGYIKTRTGDYDSVTLTRFDTGGGAITVQDDAGNQRIGIGASSKDYYCSIETKNNAGEAKARIYALPQGGGYIEAVSAGGNEKVNIAPDLIRGYFADRASHIATDLGHDATRSFLTLNSPDGSSDIFLDTLNGSRFNSSVKFNGNKSTITLYVTDYGTASFSASATYYNFGGIGMIYFNPGETMLLGKTFNTLLQIEGLPFSPVFAGGFVRSLGENTDGMNCWQMSSPNKIYLRKIGGGNLIGTFGRNPLLQVFIFGMVI